MFARIRRAVSARGSKGSDPITGATFSAQRREVLDRTPGGLIAALMDYVDSTLIQGGVRTQEKMATALLAVLHRHLQAVDLGATEEELAPLRSALNLPSTVWGFSTSLLPSENNAILFHAKPSSDEAFSTVKNTVMKVKETGISKVIFASGVGPTTEFTGWSEMDKALGKDTQGICMLYGDGEISVVLLERDTPGDAITWNLLALPSMDERNGGSKVRSVIPGNTRKFLIIRNQLRLLEDVLGGEKGEGDLQGRVEAAEKLLASLQRYNLRENRRHISQGDSKVSALLSRALEDPKQLPKVLKEAAAKGYLKDFAQARLTAYSTFASGLWNEWPHLYDFLNGETLSQVQHALEGATAQGEEKSHFTDPVDYQLMLPGNVPAKVQGSGSKMHLSKGKGRSHDDLIDDGCDLLDSLGDLFDGCGDGCDGCDGCDGGCDF